MLPPHPRSTLFPYTTLFRSPTTGKNPPYGAAINFYLKANLGEKDVAKLTITDASGNKVREIECRAPKTGASEARSEEHTSELQSRQYLVCRLLLEKKKKQKS